MRVSICVCFFVAILLSRNVQDSWQNRFGIIPLYSTRGDVERLYGKAVRDGCRCNFRRPKETIHVSFATAPCVGTEYGWNVPRDMVQSFRVTSYDPPRLSDLAPDLLGFVQRYPDSRTTYYTNVEKGIVFGVQDGNVIWVEYFPPAKENGKRCAGFPPYDGVPPARPFSMIFGRNSLNFEDVLDNFAIELLSNAGTRGYIVVYAGEKSRREEAKDMAEEAKEYLIRKRRIASDRLITIDGGFRETAEYELFSQSSQAPPPTPTPTVASNKVQIIGSKAPAKRRSPN